MTTLSLYDDPHHTPAEYIHIVGDWYMHPIVPVIVFGTILSFFFYYGLFQAFFHTMQTIAIALH